LIGVLPSVDAVLSTDQGQAWAHDRLQAALIARLQNAVRPRGDAIRPNTDSLPITIEDFVTRAERGDSGLAYFREFGPAWLRKLKKAAAGAGAGALTMPVFRLILQSQAYAAANTSISAAKWDGLLRKMIADARARGKDAGVLETWLDTRHTAQVEVMEDFDLDELDDFTDSE